MINVTEYKKEGTQESKSFFIDGDTKPLKEQFKALGAKYNMYKKGWFVSKKKMQAQGFDTSNEANFASGLKQYLETGTLPEVPEKKTVSKNKETDSVKMVETKSSEEITSTKVQMIALPISELESLFGKSTIAKIKKNGVNLEFKVS